VVTKTSFQTAVLAGCKNYQERAQKKQQNYSLKQNSQNRTSVMLESPGK